MPGIGDTLLGLARLRERRETAMANFAEPLRLTMVAPSGGNPGELRMLRYAPPGLRDGAPLVVVMHGCTQNAASYDHGSGWSALAERHGFAVLFPEQRRTNNPNLCFNWYQPEDTTRGGGEVESIHQMITETVAALRMEKRRVYVTGLSAGGAMTAAMLATYPELFAGGAIIAGLPFRSAASVSDALGAMHKVNRHSAREWGDLVRAASGGHGPIPPVQVWHGSGDTVVRPGNAEELVLQWSDALGLSPRPDATETRDGAEHATWHGRDGRVMLERWIVPGLGHGTPVATSGPDGDMLLGVPGPHMLEASISATWHLARSWGLLTQPAQPTTAARPRPVPESPAAASGKAPAWAQFVPETPFTPDFSGAQGPASIVDRALKAAGLRR